MELNENYLKGLIKATIVAFEVNTTLDDQLDMYWSFQKESPNTIRVHVRYCYNLYEKLTRVGDYENPAEFQEVSEYTEDWFLISGHENETKFCSYVNDILERMAKVEFF